MLIFNIMMSRGLGGIEQAFLDYNRAISQEGHKLINITSNKAAIHQHIRNFITLPNLFSGCIFSKIYLRILLSIYRPDFIIAHGNRAINFAKVFKPESIPLIGITHNYNCKYLRKCDYLIATTEKLRQHLVDNLYDKNKIFLLPNMISISKPYKWKPYKCQPYKSDSGRPESLIGTTQTDCQVQQAIIKQAITIGSCGRLVAKKGFACLINACAVLIKEGYKIRLLIGGSGPEENNLKKLVQELDLINYISFLGWIDNKDAFFSQIDIFCLPSLVEPFGIILLEAMHYSLPIIATNSGGPEEILRHGKEALLVEPGSGNAIAKELAVIINDPAKAQNLAALAYLRLKDNYDINIVAKKLITILTLIDHNHHKKTQEKTIKKNHRKKKYRKMSFNASKLASGLNIVSFNMPYLNTVAINIIVKVGSRFETEEERGMSHFLEHMAFKGTKTRNAEQIAKEFDAIGGYFNAYTSREHTVFYSKVLTENFKQALVILADILQNSSFKQEDIEKELNVIRQEIASINDNPDELVYEKFYAKAYKDHPLGYSISGTMEHLVKFNTQSFHDYLDKYYRADNIYLAVAGKIDHSEIHTLASELFNQIKPGTVRQAQKAIYCGGFDFTRKKLEQTSIALGFESVAYTDLTRFYQCQILAVILGGGLSSRLFQKIREQSGLVYNIGAYNSSYADSGVFSIYAAADHQNIAVLFEKIIHEIKLLRTTITQEEIKRVKAQIRSNIYMAEERPQYKSEDIGKNFALFGKYFATSEVIAIINAIESEDIRIIADEIFSKQVTLAIVGEKPKNFKFDFICNALTNPGL